MARTPGLAIYLFGPAATPCCRRAAMTTWCAAVMATAMVAPRASSITTASIQRRRSASEPRGVYGACTTMS